MSTQDHVNALVAEFPMVKFFNIMTYMPIMDSIPFSVLYLFNNQLKFDSNQGQVLIRQKLCEYDSWTAPEIQKPQGFTCKVN